MSEKTEKNLNVDKTSLGIAAAAVELTIKTIQLVKLLKELKKHKKESEEEMSDEEIY